MAKVFYCDHKFMKNEVEWCVHESYTRSH